MKLVIYATLCDPNCIRSMDYLKTILDYADILELGIPFSDPLADGLTIQKAHFRALKAGGNLKKSFEVVSKLKESFPEKKIYIMTYYNPVFKYKEDKFLNNLKEVNGDGFIIPDLPAEEGKELSKKAKALNLDPVFLVAPTSDENRIALISKVSGKNIYYVSLTGITGARESLDFENIKKHYLKVKEISNKTVWIGFGISKKEHVRALNFADAIVIGSKVVSFIEKDDIKGLKNFLKDIREEIDATPY